MLKVKIKKNLRRQILRGHPWVYRDAIEPGPSAKSAALCEASDAKGFLAWAIYDPHSPIALRILSFEKKPPGFNFLAARLDRCWKLRRPLLDLGTNAFRLVNGEGDELPGLICDVYHEVAILQFDGQGPEEFYNSEQLANWLVENVNIKSVYIKKRSGGGLNAIIVNPEIGHKVEVIENNIKFLVDLDLGQKTGFFLDQRDNRQFVKEISNSKELLNLFSYTGGFSVYAGVGGATQVTSVDISQGAVDNAQANWELNKIAGKHKPVCDDVFEFLKNATQEFDHVIVDPPSMCHSEAQKTLAIKKYVELFSQACDRVKPSGLLSLSSCSSHISFGDFQEIVVEALSAARRRGRIIRISGQGMDHPFPHVFPEFRYLKFFCLQLD